MAYFSLRDVNRLVKRSKGRVQRIFRNATGWHLLTREGMTMGPYESREEAEETLRDHFEDTVVPEHTRSMRAIKRDEIDDGEPGADDPDKSGT